MKFSVFIALSLFANVLYSQVINGYARVTAIAGNVLTVASVNEGGDSFEVGEYVVLMQMQDNVIGTTTNTADFGDVGSIASAGLFEIEIIAAITESGGIPTSITLADIPDNAYNTGANSSLQLITFPTLGAPDFTTTGNISALDWDGDVGGVVAFDVPGVLTLEHNITANAAGFRGGSLSTNFSGSTCNAANVTRFRENNNQLGFKGEGIYRSTNAAFNNGRARLVTGGGGGSHHNAGGGGGGNYVTGGLGGNGWNNCTTNPSGGFGGLSLAAHISGTRIFMGGGGGGGQQNNSQGRSGGDGGGIILISADELTTGTCAGVTIAANGVGPATSGSNDGGGGGGAGGTILFNVTTWNIPVGCPLTVQASGGNGSSSLSGGSHAGGGGGAQGVVIYNIAQPTTNTTTTTNNGIPGCGNTSNPCTSLAGAPSGSNGNGIISGASSPLPVTLLFFNGHRKNEDEVLLEWETASEVNNDKFLIEHSIDFATWKEIGEVSGQGTSNTPHFYRFVHEQPATGSNFYRLKQIDWDGAATKYGPVQVDFSQVDAVPFPNPADNEIRIWLPDYASGNTQLYLYNASGETQAAEVSFDGSELRLNTSRLANGIYMLKINSADLQGSWKFTVLHN